MKSLCDVQKSFNYYQAGAFCNNNGMDLMIVENEDVFDEMTKFVLSIYPIHEAWGYNTGLWINGRWNGSNWHTYKNLQKQEKASKQKPNLNMLVNVLS